MEKITTKQFRAIKRGLLNDTIFTRGDCIGYLKSPIMGKTIADIKFSKSKTHSVLKCEVVQTKGKEFVQWCINFDHSSQTLYVITVDGKIFYYTFSSIFAPSSSAFHTLTECYWNGHNDQMSWVWAGLNPAKCFYTMLSCDKEPSREIEYKQIKDVSKHIQDLYYHY